MVRRNGADYLERRYLLALPGFKVFWHTFWQSDPDPRHDHPWSWGRLILSGAYREFYHDGTFEDFGAGHIVWYRQARVLHRVELLTPSVSTIFWHWRRTRAWGFLDPKRGWLQVMGDGEDGRPMKGWLFPRKIGANPGEALHGG